MKPNLNRRYFAFILSVALVLAAFFVHRLLTVLFGVELPPFLTFYPAVMCVAVLFGWRFGIFSVALASFVADLLMFPPVGHLAIANRAQAISLLFFAGMGVFMSIVAEGYRRNQRQLAIDTGGALEKAHAKLESMSQHQRTLSANMDQGFAHCEMIHDASGNPCDYRILEVNAAYEKQTGLRASEVVGKTVLELFPDIEKSWVEKYGHVAATGKAERFERFNHNTGRHYDVFAYSPVRGRFCLLFLDISERKRAEAALRSSQARLQSIVSSAMDAVISVDQQQHIVLFNERAEQIFQCSAADVLGGNLDRFLPATARDAHRKHIRRFGDEGISQRAMHSPAILNGVRSNGEEFPIEATISQVSVEGKKLFTVILRDITERVRAESDHRASVVQFHTLANAIPQLAWMAHADGSIFWYNQRWFDYTGTTLQQMQGWGWQSVHDPVVLPRVLVHWKSSIATGQPFDMVFPLRGKDGYFRPFLTRVMPLKDEQGKVLRWFGTNTDISGQKQVESELRRSKARLDLAVEVAAVGEWELSFTTGTGTRSARHAQIFGYPPSDRAWSFNAFLSHVVPEYRTQVESTIAIARLEGEWDFETQIRRVDGELRWIWVRGRVQLDETGRPTRGFGTVIDVTERKQAEKSLPRNNTSSLSAGQ